MCILCDFDIGQRAGQLKDHVGSLESLTNDQVILDVIKHYHIEFEANTPVQPYPPKQIHFSPGEGELITKEISKLLNKGVLEKTEYAEGITSSESFGLKHKLVILMAKSLSNGVKHLKLLRPGNITLLLGIADT